MIDLKTLNIWPREVLELLIKQFGKMVLFIVGILKIINGKGKAIINIMKVGQLL